MTSLRCGKPKSKREFLKFVVLASAATCVLIAVAILEYGVSEEIDVGPAPMVSFTIEEVNVTKTPANDAVFLVKLKNHATTTEQEALICRVSPSNYPPFYSNESISLLPEEVKTFEIVLDLPSDAVWVPDFKSGQVNCYFSLI